ncbi:MAG: ATP-binding protein, partial [Prochloraceae cyanobacterium]
MTALLESHWYQNNLNYLDAEIERISQILELHIAAEKPKISPLVPINNWSGSSLDSLGSRFNLSSFEKEILLLCLARELDPYISSLCEAIQGRQKAYPTLSLAISCFSNSSTQVLLPSSPLQEWELIEFLNDLTLAQAPIKLDRRIFSYLLGETKIAPELIGLVEEIPLEFKNNYLPDSQLKIIENTVNIWNSQSQERDVGNFQNTNKKPILQLCGNSISSKYAIAYRLGQKLNANLNILSANVLPTNPKELDLIKKRWEREAILSERILLLDCDEIDGLDPVKVRTISRFIESLNAPLIISSNERRATRYRPLISFDVPSLSYLESKSVWRDFLGERAAQLNGQLERVASQFNLSPHGIEATCYSVKANDKNGNSLSDNLWNACRISARPKLDNLAQRIESDATWEDLIIPKDEKDLLKDIAIQVKQKQKVYQEWGFSSKKRGLGITALFHGTSGTGKTMAAEVIANTLNLDLYRIDLSSVVSKYIGETEKNLRKIFAAAETGGAVLLFDEADAIFGKRTQVKDSHDRHANIEVSYLLQRMESYQGLAILTTNFKENLDLAFSRRIRFMVKFAFPDTESRSKIWQRIFPAQTPTS